jgi:hypothetical protein
MGEVAVRLGGSRTSIGKLIQIGLHRIEPVPGQLFLPFFIGMRAVEGVRVGFAVGVNVPIFEILHRSHRRISRAHVAGEFVQRGVNQRRRSKAEKGTSLILQESYNE